MSYKELSKPGIACLHWHAATVTHRSWEFFSLLESTSIGVLTALDWFSIWTLVMEAQQKRAHLEGQLCGTDLSVLSHETKIKL